MPSQPTYVPWSSTTQPGGRRADPRPGEGSGARTREASWGFVHRLPDGRRDRGQFHRHRNRGGLTGHLSTARCARLITNQSGDKYRILDTRGAEQAILNFAYKPESAPLAYDQIYIARGTTSTGPHAAADNVGSVIPGSNGDYGSMLVNGVGVAAVPDQLGTPDRRAADPQRRQGGAAQRALDDARRAQHRQLDGSAHRPRRGAAGSGPCLQAGAHRQGKAEAQQALAQSNITQMLDQYQQDASAQGKDLLARIEKSLNLGPFKLTGDADVKLESDGSATLTVGASLPGLAGSATAKNDPRPRRAKRWQPDRGSGDDPRRSAGAPGAARDPPGGRQRVPRRDRAQGREARLQLHHRLQHQGADHRSGPGQPGARHQELPAGHEGKLQDLNIDYLAGTGLGIPLGYGVFITKIGADINVAADQFAAHAVFGIGMSVGAGCPPIGVDTTLQVKFSDPFRIDGNATVIVTCVPLANIHLTVEQSGLISLVGKGGFDAGPVYFHVELGAQFDHGLFQVYGHGDGGIRKVLQGAVDAVISNRGVAACGSVDVTIPIVGDVISVFTGSRTIHLAGGASVDFKGGHPRSPCRRSSTT